MTGSPHPVDVHVGARLRARREAGGFGMITARIAALGNTAERVQLIHDIAGIIGRYRAEPRGKKWGIANKANGTATPALYDDEDMARSGARLLAACDIVEMLEAVPA